MLKRINKLLNLSDQEWPRIIIAWSMMFLSQLGYIIGWSALVASFLGEIGIEYLPYLFLSNAILVVAGVFLFKKWIHLIRREVLITFTVIIAAALIISSVFFIQSQALIAFALLLTAEGVFLAQLNIMLSLFNEDLFSPLESQRTFPIIESALTLGGILGGLFLTTFSAQLPVYKFILIWALIILGILPIVLRFNAKTMNVPQLKSVSQQKKSKKKLTKKAPFLKGLILVVLLHWGMMNIIEFQYTKAIQQEVYSVQEETLVFDESIQLAEESETHNEQVQYEQAIARKLGLLHVIFNSAALFIQLILASRLITSLGIISSLLIHPLVTFLNVVGMTLRFGFVSAAITRGSYELTGVLYKNSYDSSYYAIPHQERDTVKEFMQGIIKPFGAILGTASILGISLLFHGRDQTLALNIELMAMAIIMSIVLFGMGKRYTELSEQNLSKKKDLPTRLNAIEILGQNGHEKNVSALHKLLRRANEPEVLKINILRSLGERREAESIGVILEFLEDPSARIRLAAIQALRQFEELKKGALNQAFTRHRVIEALKEALKSESEDGIKKELMHFFYTLDAKQLTHFIFESIKSKNAKEKGAFIRMLRLFKDPNLKYYLEPYLKNKSVELRSASIIALWSFEEMHHELTHHLNQMLKSPKSRILKIGIQTAGEVSYKEAKATIKAFLGHAEEEIRNAALIALAQMEDHTISKELVSYLSDTKHEWFEKGEQLIQNLPKNFRAFIERQLHSHIHTEIRKLLEGKSLEEMGEESLKRLEKLYQRIEAHEQVHQIQCCFRGDKKI